MTAAIRRGKKRLIILSAHNLGESASVTFAEVIFNTLTFFCQDSVCMVMAGLC